MVYLIQCDKEEINVQTDNDMHQDLIYIASYSKEICSVCSAEDCSWFPHAVNNI